MDPNANLEEQLRLAKEMLRRFDDCGGEPTFMESMRLAELVIALDGWLSNSGFLPKAWERKTQRGHEHPLDMPCIPPCQMAMRKD